MRPPRFLLVLLLILLAGVVRADIVFFDLNDNQQERAAAERAAAARGEKLIDVALVDEATRQQLREHKAVVEDAESDKRKRCFGKGKESDACGRARRDYESALAKFNSFATNMRRFGAADIDGVFADLKRKGVDVSSIVISGHDGDRQYWGTLGWFDDDNLMDALVANPSIGQNLRSLYLWGCYTAVNDDFRHMWKRGIPNSTMIAGFDGQSPLGKEKPSAALLEDLLVKESRLTQTRDQKELMSIFKSLPDINNANARAAICLDNRETLVSHRGVRRPEDDDRMCEPGEGEEKQWEERFDCYRFARPGCEEIPEWTDERNELRRMYSYAQVTKHCWYVDHDRGVDRQLIPVQVRRLLFDNVIRRNFERHHKKDLEALNRLLTYLGFPPNLRMTNIGSLSRGQYLARLRAIKEHWNLQSLAAADEQGRVHDARLVAVGNYLSAIDRVEDGVCVPGSWLETQGPLDDSQCGPREGLPTIGNQMKNAFSDAQRTVMSYRE